ncbi:DUF2025 family protein [Pseudomonas argentinensis]|uniref:PA1123-like domain-containing protein n=1 Tax=Phytopseudomonas argentinensis TaxID=289370 RepID=A0A1I3GYC7_9GAMM|nr:DUF2025 family protein [Pseudomonas argentinensis]KAB0548803.1 DUF2025 family protein [Pseudomonas argentinensis]SFI28280.1 Protein of unknown function [Pseudomonas argentinensis]
MAITSAGICAAADQLQGFVGFNLKTGQHIVRFSEDSFGLDITEDSITPTSEFVWEAASAELMTLKRDRLRMLVELRIDERLAISEPLRVYLRREDLPEIAAVRQLQRSG